MEGVWKRFGGDPTLSDVTFSIPEGTAFGLVGPAGAGKTTAMRILATILAADRGRVTIAGESDRRAVRRLIGYLPDRPGFYERLTASEYIEFYAGIHLVNRSRRALLARELLEALGLSERGDAEVASLDRGEKQRLCLARTLVHDPPVLLLDEPLSGLDGRSTEEVRALIAVLGDVGKTVLLSSRTLADLRGMCSWLGFLDAGRVLAAGPVSWRPDGSDGHGGLRMELEALPNDGSVVIDRLCRFAGVRQVRREPYGIDVTLVDQSHPRLPAVHFLKEAPSVPACPWPS